MVMGAVWNRRKGNLDKVSNLVKVSNYFISGGVWEAMASRRAC